MTRIFTTGAEMGDMLFWDSTTGTPTNVTTAPRSGSRHYSINNATAQKNLTPALSEFYFRLPCYFTGTAINKFIIWRNGSTELGSIRKNTATQKLEIYTGTGTLQATGSIAITINTWVMIEVHVKIADSGGAIDIRLEGNAEVSFSGDTKPGADTTVDNLVVNNAGIGNALYVDDVALNNTSGSADNSWCGDGKIVLLSPTSAGDVTQLTPSAGANWQCVDDIPPNTTDYVSSATAGQYDLYNCGSYTLGTGETVLRVQVEARCLEETAAGDSVGLGVKTQSTENFDAGHVVTTSYARYVGTDYTTNPTSGVAWTQADLDALQVGEKVI